MLQNLHLYTEAELIEIDKIVEELTAREYRLRCRNSLIEFCKAMQSDYKVGRHHRRLAKLLMEIEAGLKDRICVSVPPRHGKSQMVSIFYAAWYLGRNPDHKVMLVSHTADLAVDFGRKVRNLIASDKYQEIFEGVTLAQDSKSAGRWNTNHGGEFFAAGVGAALAGRGAHLLLVDDPHSEQDVLAGNFETFEKAYSWFAYGARTRLMPGGRVAIVHTRWHQDDLIGRVTRDMAANPDADQYEIFEFPAIIEEKVVNDDGEEEYLEKALWPEFFDIPALKRTKASMPPFQWNAQYQQNPTGEESAVIKREWWQRWKESRFPPCEYIISSLDAAAELNNRADYSVITTWGVFVHEQTNTYNLMLLDVVRDRLEFPELKRVVRGIYKDFEPDAFIVEKKSAGTALFQEFRRAGIPISEYTPHRGTGDKMARLNSVSDIISSGLVWVPETRWGDELIEEVAGFPFMAHDDQVDSMVMALMRFRQGGFLTLPTDEDDDLDWNYPRKAAYY